MTMSLLNMSLSATALILVIVIIRGWFLRKLPKQTFLLLWGIVLSRLLIPFYIPSAFSIYSIIHNATGRAPSITLSMSDISHTYRNISIPEAASALPKTGLAPASPYVIIWLIGLVVSALVFLVTHLRYRREYRTALPVEHEWIRQWAFEHPLRRSLQIQQSDRIHSPLTYGVFRPVILLPKHTDWTDEARLRYILAHEFVHVRRFDTLLKWVTAAALCVHWFNPMVWLMYVLINRDIELSCDEAVVQNFGGTHKSAYALTLIDLEEQKNRFTPLVNHFNKNAIEGRIKSIMQYKKTSRLSILVSIVLVTASAATFATSADARDSNPTGVEHSKATVTQGYSAFVFDVVELSYYDNGWPYLHDIKTNHTDKIITGLQYGMLAYDASGHPLKLQWNFLDSSAKSTYDHLVVEEELAIRPGQTYNTTGGWSLYDSKAMDWPGMDHAGPNKVAYALYQIKKITFADGSVWDNNGYEGWLDTYKGKTVKTAALESFYPLEVKIKP
jgi:beta-lactamase regulating signal transducer with metallopeptidase domain